MTKTNMDLSGLLAKQDGGDFLRSVAEAVLQLIMEADVEGLIGAGKHERADQRTTWRNGYRERALDTRLGTLNLKVPKLRQGSYFPGFLEPRKTSEKALVAVIQGEPFSRHWSERQWRTGSAASRPAVSTNWPRPWGFPVSPRARCRSCARTSMSA
jgi:hypothetical protein